MYIKKFVCIKKIKLYIKENRRIVASVTSMVTIEIIRRTLVFNEHIANEHLLQVNVPNARLNVEIANISDKVYYAQLTRGGHNFIKSDPSIEWGSLQDWSSSFTLEQKGIFAMMTLLLIIAACVFDILMIIYFDQLFDKYDLSAKYPVLARWIKYRKAFMNYYLLINFSLIFIIILFLFIELYLIFFV